MDEIQSAINRLIDAKTYVCIPAIRSHQSGDYRVGVYGKIGEESRKSRKLYNDIISFRDWQKSTGSPYSTFWAVFEKLDQPLSEEEFEEKLWQELSGLCAQDDPNTNWDKNFSSDPTQPNFCPSIGGDAYFIVGVHPASSRIARQFEYPAILFNLYDQFEELDRRGQYESIVRMNRKREIAKSGALNPMVEKYGDKWEAIQFSGRENSAEWKCPFHHGAKLTKTGEAVSETKSN